MIINTGNSEVDFFESRGCTQLANGLRGGQELGRQRESSGSLNGFHPVNPYKKVLDGLKQQNYVGVRKDQIRRAVDTAFATEGIKLDPDERDEVARWVRSATVGK
jgi:hypothetical protein